MRKKQLLRFLEAMMLLLYMLSPLSAQNLHVESFTEAKTDIAALTMERKDANGNACALIRVYVLDDVTAAQGNVVGELSTNGIEKLVYVCGGTKMLKLKFKYHFPLDITFSDYGIEEVASTMTYDLKISEGSSAMQPAAVNEPVVDTRETARATEPQNTVQQKSDDVRTFTVEGVSFDMVYVEGGTYMMGANDGDSEANSDEKPLHEVTLSGYYMGKTEVTQALWQAVMGNNPSYFKGDDLPVEGVSWKDCQKFIRELNTQTGEQFSLPTEAEWEYAARGGGKSLGYKYSGSNSIGNVAWYGSISGVKTHAVGVKQPNELGLYDMTGNVCEWCADWYGHYRPSSQSDSTGPSSGSYRVIRGGCWGNSTRSCRVSFRDRESSSSCSSSVGLRLSIRRKKETNETKKKTRTGIFDAILTSPLRGAQ